MENTGIEQSEKFTDTKVSMIRKTIGKRLGESQFKFTAIVDPPASCILG